MGQPRARARRLRGFGLTCAGPGPRILQGDPPFGELENELQRLWYCGEITIEVLLFERASIRKVSEEGPPQPDLHFCPSQEARSFFRSSYRRDQVMTSTVYRPKAGDTAVITGAGYGGIGYDTALLLATRFQIYVLLADRDSAALEKASEGLIAAGVAEGDFATRVTDVSDANDMLELANAVFQSRGKVDFLHLNAGVSTEVKAYGEDIVDEWQRTFAVNLFGVVNGAQAFVDRMVQQDSPAAVVITGSKQGITNPPGTSAAYNGALVSHRAIVTQAEADMLRSSLPRSFQVCTPPLTYALVRYSCTDSDGSLQAVKTLAEALAHQLLSTRVSVHLLVSGWTWTKLASPAKGAVAAYNASEKPDAAWSPAQVAEELLRRMQEGEFYILCPDGAVKWELDRARMEWGMGDVLEKRPPLSRWHPEWEKKHEEFVKERTVGASE